MYGLKSILCTIQLYTMYSSKNVKCWWVASLQMLSSLLLAASLRRNVFNINTFICLLQVYAKKRIVSILVLKSFDLYNFLLADSCIWDKRRTIFGGISKNIMFVGTSWDSKMSSAVGILWIESNWNKAF